MQSINISSYESGTIIPACGLDQPTDMLRRCFGMTLWEFQNSFENDASPGRWLYYLLSTQRYIQARLTVLIAHIEKSQLEIKKIKLLCEGRLFDSQASLTESVRLELQEKLQKIDHALRLLETIHTRINAPQEQLGKVGDLRLVKVERFRDRYQELLQQLAHALSTGGLSYFSNTALNGIMAYLFGMVKQPTKSQEIDREQIVNDKILGAVQPLAPNEYYPKIAEIFTQQTLWKILSCSKNIPVAVALTPVIVAILREFDIFSAGHEVLIERLEKMKQGLGSIEKYYADTLLNLQIPTVIDERFKEIYTRSRELTPSPVAESAVKRSL